MAAAVRASSHGNAEGVKHAALLLAIEGQPRAQPRRTGTRARPRPAARSARRRRRAFHARAGCRSNARTPTRGGKPIERPASLPAAAVIDLKACGALLSATMAKQEHTAEKQRAEEGGEGRLELVWRPAQNQTGLGRTLTTSRTSRWFEQGRSIECPNEQAVEFRTVLLSGLKQRRPIGMPSTLPKFIVVCNLSGLRRLYYSNSHGRMLVTFLTKPPSAARDVSSKVLTT